MCVITRRELEQQERRAIYDAALSGVPHALESLFSTSIDYFSGYGTFELEEFLLDVVYATNEIAFDLKRREESSSNLISEFNESLIARRLEIVLNRRNPFLVARHALELLERSATEDDRWPLVAWAIHLLGWSLLMQKFQGKCAFCPRATDLGTRFCDEHSQVLRNSGDKERSSRQQRYRWGLQARAIADRFLLMAPYESDQWPEDGGGYLEDLTRQQWLRQLQGLPYGLDRGLILITRFIFLMNKILESKRVLAQLGGKKKVLGLNNYDELVEYVIQHLNPFQRREDDLFTVVESFELWFYLEKLVRRRKRGAGQLATKKLNKAIAMAEAGARQKDIAIACGVRESTVAAWVSRSEILRHKLKQQRRRRAPMLIGLESSDSH